MPPGRIVILSPHFDDAVFSLGGLIATRPRDVTVVTVFAGVPEKPVQRIWDRACGFRDSTEAVEKRKQEDREALTSLGVAEDEIRYFGYLDAQYRKDTRTSELLLQKQIIESAGEVIASLQGELQILVPLLGLHKDHRLVRDALKEWYEQAADSRVSLYCYQDMPYTVISFRRKRFFHPFTTKKKILDRFRPKDGAWKSVCIPFDASRAEMKMRAIRRYASQFRFRLTSIGSLFASLPRLSHMQSALFGDRSPECEVAYRKER